MAKPISIDTLAAQRLSEFQHALAQAQWLTPDSSELSAQDAQLTQAMQGALSDDAQVGPNDKPWLDAMAKDIPGAVAIIDKMAAAYKAPAIRHPSAHSAFAVRAFDFKPGADAFTDGLNSAKKPRLDLTYGRPEGRGANVQSLDVLALGRGGSITLTLGAAAKQGVIVYGNPFYLSGTSTLAQNKPANVEVSADGKHWTTLGQAGFKPVFANSENKIASKSEAAGGDRFDFAAAGYKGKARYVRITDANLATTGDGFALDAVRGY